MVSSVCRSHNVQLVYYWQVQKDGSSKLTKACPTCNELVKVELDCKKCGYKNSYYVEGKNVIIKCLNCSNGLKLNQKVLNRSIPDWRLNVDDASEEEIRKNSYKDFGITPQSQEEWDAHYANEPYEVEKTKEFQTKQNELVQEVLG